jgi:hypothetical protein
MYWSEGITGGLQGASLNNIFKLYQLLNIIIETGARKINETA